MGGEAAGGGGRGGADTELKTKTPHVNVGKNCDFPVRCATVYQRVAFITWNCNKALLVGATVEQLGASWV